MTKRDFISRRDSFKNRTAIASLVMFVALMGSVFLLARVGDGHKDWLPSIRLPLMGMLLVGFIRVETLEVTIDVA